MPDEMFNVLTSAPDLLVLFQGTTDDWQWQYEEDDDGGGYFVVPYAYDTYTDDSDTDLCDEAIWCKAIEAQLVVTTDSSRKDDLLKVLAMLESKGKDVL